MQIEMWDGRLDVHLRTSICPADILPTSGYSVDPFFATGIRAPALIYKILSVPYAWFLQYTTRWCVQLKLWEV